MMLLLADVIYSLLKMNAAPLPELMIWLWHRDRGGEQPVLHAQEVLHAGKVGRAICVRAICGHD